MKWLLERNMRWQGGMPRSAVIFLVELPGNFPHEIMSFPVSEQGKGGSHG